MMVATLENNKKEEATKKLTTTSTILVRTNTTNSLWKCTLMGVALHIINTLRMK